MSLSLKVASTSLTKFARVSEVIQGWALQVEYRQGEHWYELATIFAKNLRRRVSQPLAFKEKERAKFAFLDGVGWGCGPANARHSATLLATKERKAKDVGLEDPARIVTDRYHAAKIAVLSSQNTQSRRLKEYHEQHQWLLPGTEDDLEDAMDEDDDVDMEDVQPSTPTRISEEDEITYEDDDD